LAKVSRAILLVLVVVLVIDSSAVLDYEDKEDDSDKAENWDPPR
jgi:hypothetical protein